MKKIAFGFSILACACGFSVGDPNSLSQSDTQSVPARRGTVIADGCLLDSWQMDTLATPAAKLVIREVVLDCMLPHADGTVSPSDASAQSQLDALVSDLHQLGYSVSIAASFVADNGYVYDGAQTAQELANTQWVLNATKGIAAVAHAADAVDLDLAQLPATSRADLTHFVSTLAPLVRPTRKLNVLLPPSTTTPSDVPGGDAFDVASLSAFTDRFRVMTLDFSGTSTPGPTIDSGWAVDAVRFAQTNAGSAAVDVAFPLYGNDFVTSGMTQPARVTTFLEATGAADAFNATPNRSSSQELFLDYDDDTRVSHELWYDDEKSTLVTLRAWDTTTLPTSVGVVFYGFGAEDPALWNAIAQASK